MYKEVVTDTVLKQSYYRPACQDNVATPTHPTFSCVTLCTKYRYWVFPRSCTESDQRVLFFIQTWL